MQSMINVMGKKAKPFCKKVFKGDLGFDGKQVDLTLGTKVYFAGICGVGMSALAQAFKWLGCDVAGSDRNISSDGVNGPLLAFFERKGIKIFAQNGSFIDSFRPDFVVYSTALEKDNPDFTATGNIPMLHRSEALSMFLEHMKDRLTVAVTGTSGKTTVTSWLGESLVNCGEDPVIISGGKMISLSKDGAPGNFRSGNGRFVVFEADESDKSLLNCPADYGIILNTGTDHYSEAEQIEVFAKFAEKIRKGIICEAGLFTKIAKSVPKEVRTMLFCDKNNNEVKNLSTGFLTSVLESFCVLESDEKIFSSAQINIGNERYHLKLPVLGKHNALNAASLVSAMIMLGIDDDKIPSALENFRGVKRRFQYHGRVVGGARIFDDYAHNPEKISSCIIAAQAIGKGSVHTIFQPHGYGPLGFMKNALLEKLKVVLRLGDSFAFLPVYYVGGTSSFSPKSEEIVSEFTQKGLKNCVFCPSREAAEELISKSRPEDIVIIMGARDESLSNWASNLC